MFCKEQWYIYCHILFYNDPCLKSNCIRQKRGPMSSEVHLLVLSHSQYSFNRFLAGTYPDARCCYGHGGGSSGHRQLDHFFPTSFAVRCDHMRKSHSGNVNSVLLSRALRIQLIFLPKIRIRTLLGPRSILCVLPHLNLFPPSFTCNHWDFSINRNSKFLM